ncbi:hypothetical protein L2750_07925 [Shewanella submarina]|uniref:Uncharacterized protein n=1 Tax=Shewanella submarina TaxID=2016376 RepID=A0ABV7GER7_9GAMM|nr:hypothetical protein [Shewanella submarina]MCL1037078.1 hypothetical protein [Shewanella submarina]
MSILTCLLVCLGVIWHLTQNKSNPVMMSCSSELFDRSDDSGYETYLLVDLIMQGRGVQLNYRYFDTQGANLGSIAMTGELKSVSSDNRLYTLNMHKKQESASVMETLQPSHMKYISYISSLNLNAYGNHNLSIEVLEQDDTNDYAIVLFQPSNTVCGCRLMQ